MSDLGKLARIARERKQKQAKEGKNNNEPAAKKNVFTGANPKLPVIDHVPNRLDVGKFNEMKRTVVSVIGAEFGVNAHPLEHGTEFEFTVPQRPADHELGDVADPHGITKALFLDEWRSYRKKLDAYEENKPKVYSMLKGQCTTAILNVLKGLPNWEDIELEKNPLPLWLEIVNISMNGTAVDDDGEKRIIDASRRFQMFRQKKETVGDFYERFEAEYQALRGSGASLIRVEVPNGMDPDEAEELNDEISRREEKQKALYFINKLDKTRFGGMMDDLQNAYDRGRNEYPVSLTSAYQMALNYRENGRRVDSLPAGNNEQYGAAFAANGNKEKKKGNNGGFNKNKKRGGGEDKDFSSYKCFLCGEEGHIRQNCPILKKAREYLEKEEKQKSEEALMICGTEFIGCTFCGEDTDEQPVLSLGTQNEQSDGFAPTQVLCDNQSSVNVFCNPSLLTNIRKSDTTMVISGINKNGEPIKTNTIGDFAWFGKVYYHPEAVANILSFHDLAKRFPVTFDSEKNCFIVITQDGKQIKFSPKGKHYCHETKKLFRRALIDTVEQNKSQFTTREVEQARAAADLYEIMGRPSYRDLIQAVNRGTIMNCPITAKDINRAIQIWGPDLGTIKGKMVRSTPDPVPSVDNFGSFEEKEVILCVDICFIRGLEFLASISRRLCLLVVIYLPDRSKKSITKAFDEIKSVYLKFKIGIKAIYTDGEGAVNALKIYVEAGGTLLETTSKNEHVHEIERSIRVIKERVRSFTTTLPFTLPNVLVIHLVYYCVAMINSFPRSSSIAPGVPPKETLTGRKMDFKRDCSLKFGSYVQVYEEDLVTNTLKERTLGAISLGPVGNIQGSYNFLSLKTWKVVKRRSWVGLPMPDVVIELLNKKANDDIAFLKQKGVVFELENDDQPGILDDQPVDEIEEQVDDNTSVATPAQVVVIDEAENEEHEDDEHHSDDESVVSTHDPADSGVDIGDAPAIDNVIGEEIIAQDVVGDEKKNIETVAPTRTSDSNYFLRPPKVPKWKLTVFVRNGTALLSNVYVQKAVVEFGLEGVISMMREMKQLMTKNVFHPVQKSSLSKTQWKKLLRSLMFLKRKRDGRLKARFVVNGSKQDRNLAMVDPNSPTVSLESIFISIVIECIERRKVITIDIEGAYLHVAMKGEVIVVIEAVIADILVELDPTYKDFVDERGQLYVILDKALYGCIESAKLFNEHLIGTLKGMGFIQNAYDPCVLNKIVDSQGHQCTVTIHVDDLKVSCVDKKYLETFVKELTSVYGKLNVHSEDVLDYLGMDLDYSVPGCAKVSMVKMVKETIVEFGMKLDDKNVTTPLNPATAELFCIDEASEVLDTKAKEKFHSLVAKMLYMAKRARPDILTAVSFLTTRVLCPTKQDWKKLERIVKYLYGSIDLSLNFNGNKIEKNMSINVYVDASFAIHHDKKSHTGVWINIGNVGSIYCKSSKQKLVTRSSTEAELVAVGDTLGTMIWIRNLLLEQGYKNLSMNLYQDNRSTIMLMNKGRSTSQRTRHIDIRYFHIHDCIEKGILVVVDMDTDDMVADLFTKVVLGVKFTKFVGQIMLQDG